MPQRRALPGTIIHGRIEQGIYGTGHRLYLMPELPEVETTRRGIAPALMGRRVTDVIVRDRRLRWPIERDFESSIRHQMVRRVERRAKYLLIGFDTGTLIVHLGMSGSLRILDAKIPPKPHDHWDLVLDSGKVLRFHDPRRFGERALDGVGPTGTQTPGKACAGAVGGRIRCRSFVSRHAQAQRCHQTAHHEFSGSGGSRQHLRERSLVPRRHFPAPRLSARHACSSSGAHQGHQRRARRGHRDRWHHLARLRQCRRHTRLFSPEALRVRARRTALPNLQNAGEAICARTTIDLLVSQLPALKGTGARRSSRIRGLADAQRPVHPGLISKVWYCGTFPRARWRREHMSNRTCAAGAFGSRSRHRAFARGKLRTCGWERAVN